MHNHEYIMEHAEEALRLDLKTDRESVHKQALWAGLQPGMRVADIGCGSGKTTSLLHELLQPSGSIVGVDASETRIAHAAKNHGGAGVEFVCRDIYEPINDLGQFDFIWVRFVLEYHRSKSTEIVKKLSELLKPGGILCLIDLDYNCLSHFGLSQRLENTIGRIMALLEKDFDFDPYIGRKLYSFLYDIGLEDIAVQITTHHLIYGSLNEIDAYNWTKKVEVAAQRSGYAFDEYSGGYGEFQEEFERFFSDPRRFTYTPLVCCRGRKTML